MYFDQFLKRACYYELANEYRLFKTWFRTPTGGWTENPDEADWQRWHNLPNGALCVDVRYEQYYLIDGVRYDDINQALEAATFEIFKPYLLNYVLNVFEKIKRRQRNKKKQLSKLIYHNEVNHARSS